MAEAAKEEFFGGQCGDDNAGAGLQDQEEYVDSDADLEDSMRCVKLPLADHIAAYLEERELIRTTESISCDSTLVTKVTNNYIIVKLILSTLPWQDKMLCKLVCSTWNCAVKTLLKEQLSCEDFVMVAERPASKRLFYKTSGNLKSEPLVIFTFSNTTGFNISCKCDSLTPTPCIPACDKEHCMLDLAHQTFSAPKECMFTVRATYIAYMPLPHSPTHKHLITQRMIHRKQPFIGGISIPKIPDVDFKLINMKTFHNVKEDFYDVVDKIAETNIVKGVLVYVTDTYILGSVEDIVFLNHFKEVQPDIPYALGGCIIEDTTSDQSDIHHIINGINLGKEFVSENLVSIGVFTVPKLTETQGENNNFDMFSLVVESKDWAKTNIQKTINDFANKIPHYENSVVLKLSCVGRDQKHELEQQYFRAAFPSTPLIGCYGNGELGVNHPEPPPRPAHKPVKRIRHDSGPQYGILYSYSTVFVYIGWGKITSEPPRST